MLARLGSTRVAATTDDTLDDIAPGESVGRLGQRRPADEADAHSLSPAEIVAPHPRIDALAARTDQSIQILVWHQVCDQYATGERNVTVLVAGLDGWPAVNVQHWRIDAQHSNAHTAWQAQGCPDWPTAEAIQVIKQSEKLARYGPDKTIAPTDGMVELTFALPIHGMSLIILARHT